MLRLLQRKHKCGLWQLAYIVRKRYFCARKRTIKSLFKFSGLSEHELLAAKIHKNDVGRPFCTGLLADSKAGLPQNNEYIEKGQRTIMATAGSVCLVASLHHAKEKG